MTTDVDLSAIRHPHPGWVTCPFTGKNRFETKDDAKRAMAMIRHIPKISRKRRGRPRAKIEKKVIRCSGCDGYHLTSSGRK